MLRVQLANMDWRGAGRNYLYIAKFNDGTAEAWEWISNRWRMFGNG